MAAEAAEAAAAEGQFWEYHDLLLRHQDELHASDLDGYARDLDLDIDRFWDGLRSRRFAARVAEDVATADASGVAGTPSFFINGRRHEGAYDVETLNAAVRAARWRATVSEAAGQAESVRG
jgi:protein-disulfide isomerase